MARPSLRLIAALSAGLVLGPLHWAMAEYPVYDDGDKAGEHKPAEPVLLPGGYVIEDARTFLACFASPRDSDEKTRAMFLENPDLSEKVEVMYCLKFHRGMDAAKYHNRLQAEWGTLWRGHR